MKNTENIPSGKWKILIDTGGTFTDCLAITPDGIEKRIKVLSNSCIRGKIIRKVDAYVYQFEASWSYPSWLLSGYSLSILGTSKKSKLLSINYLHKTITLEDNLTPLINADFELHTQEEAPVLATRLATQTPLHAPFPPLEMRLGTTKGTNALLERKGAKTLLLVTKGFKDLLEIGTQQRPDLFQLNIPQPALLYDRVVEIDERIDAKGNIITPVNLHRIADQADGYESVAISLLNAYVNAEHEKQVVQALSGLPLDHVSQSGQLHRGIHYLRRTQTTLVNAYLSPILKRYFSGITKSLGSSVKVMTSAGGLVSSDHFFAKDSLLSGPAGGMAAATKWAHFYGFQQVITFDMGGTSTDTARIEQRPEIRYLTQIDGIEFHNPSLAIETVAAGGGSICRYDGNRLQVGPESAGASPGPACYGANGPLTITDVNLLLGKIDPDYFEIPIRKDRAEEALTQIQQTILKQSGKLLDKTEILHGFEQIANEKMADAIRRISLARGADPKDHALITFGGAGGLHGCQLADLMNISTVLIPYDAGLFSAVGMGSARENRILTKQILQPFRAIEHELNGWREELYEEAAELLIAAGVESLETGFCSVFLRLLGQESSIEIPFSASLSKDFEVKYRELYGYFPTDHPLEVESMRIMVQEVLPDSPPYIPVSSHHTAHSKKEISTRYQPALPLYKWDEQETGATISGPAVLSGTTSTTFVPEGWDLVIQANKDAIVIRQSRDQDFRASSHEEAISLELFTNRFQAIAEEMGAQLQRTAFSVNVKERLDFSCALLDPEGELLVNAPHIPVHLGSLGICARLVRKELEIGPGDVVITNHPQFGGSHLPDVTLLSGVFTAQNQCVGYVINRAHHAEIGGKRPGSMPPDATNLEQEGVVIPPTYLVKKGQLQWKTIHTLFTESRYPTRSYSENEADISAAMSSLKKGETLLLELVQKHGLKQVRKYMELIKQNALIQLKTALVPYMDRTLRAVEYLDDGHRIAVTIEITPLSMKFDFSGTSKVHPNNLNANISILYSCILYVLRLLINKNIPLNEGLIRNVTIKLPENSLLNPVFDPDPEKCPAVVGGNTEVSQRLVDTLLKAFQLAACSQGTMNNFLFGTKKFGYYETIGGGAGAGPGFNGKSGVHQHMTNTRITDTEELERKYPVRIKEFGLRPHSGGEGTFKGGDGIIRTIESLEELEITLIGQHRYFSPYGLDGGKNGKTAEHYLIRKDGSRHYLPGICDVILYPGDIITIATPGGGGYGITRSEEETSDPIDDQ